MEAILTQLIPVSYTHLDVYKRQKYLSDNIYNLTVEKGKSAQGSVAFLRKIGSNEPLYFVGYGKTIKFDIATSDRSKSSMDTSFAETVVE